MTEYIKVANISDLNPGEKMLVEYDDDDVGLFNIDGEFYEVPAGRAHCACNFQGKTYNRGEVRGGQEIFPDIFIEGFFGGEIGKAVDEVEKPEFEVLMPHAPVHCPSDPVFEAEDGRPVAV